LFRGFPGLLDLRVDERFEDNRFEGAPDDLVANPTILGVE
jgi:hypothetical protein